MKMGEKLPQKAGFENFGKLLILSDVEDSDGGKYMCKAQNSAGDAVHYFDVIVEGAFKSRAFVRLSLGVALILTLLLAEPPKWLMEPPQDQLTVIGSDVHIKCSVSGKPPPDITWRKNGEVFTGEWGLFHLWRHGQWSLQFTHTALKGNPHTNGVLKNYALDPS